MNKGNTSPRAGARNEAHSKKSPYNPKSMMSPQRDVIRRLQEYEPNGPRDKERPEILALPGMRTWTRELAREANRQTIVAAGYCLKEGAPLLLTSPGVADIQAHRRALVGRRATDQVEWIDVWKYPLRNCTRVRLRVTSD